MVRSKGTPTKSGTQAKVTESSSSSTSESIAAAPYQPTLPSIFFRHAATTISNRKDPPSYSVARSSGKMETEDSKLPATKATPGKTTQPTRRSYGSSSSPIVIDLSTPSPPRRKRAPITLAEPAGTGKATTITGKATHLAKRSSPKSSNVLIDLSTPSAPPLRKRAPTLAPVPAATVAQPISTSTGTTEASKPPPATTHPVQRSPASNNASLDMNTPSPPAVRKRTPTPAPVPVPVPALAPTVAQPISTSTGSTTEASKSPATTHPVKRSPASNNASLDLDTPSPPPVRKRASAKSISLTRSTSSKPPLNFSDCSDDDNLMNFDYKVISSTEKRRTTDDDAAASVALPTARIESPAANVASPTAKTCMPSDSTVPMHSNESSPIKVPLFQMPFELPSPDSTLTTASPQPATAEAFDNESILAPTKYPAAAKRCDRQANDNINRASVRASVRCKSTVSKSTIWEDQKMPAVQASSNDKQPSTSPSSETCRTSPRSSKALTTNETTSRKQSKQVWIDKPRMESQELKDRMLQVGDPVYAPYPGKKPSDEPYYWGKIVNKYPRTDFSESLYNIEFDDGDFLERLESEPIHRLSEALDLIDHGWIEGEPPPPEYVGEIAQAPLTPLELFQQRCQECSQCKTRLDCGKCAICVQNSIGGKRTAQQCCYQKTCSKLSIQQKARPSSFLPNGWSFFFGEEKTNRDKHGLYLIRREMLAKKKKMKYKSFETAQIKFPQAFRDFDPPSFYREVGLCKGGSKKTNALLPARGAQGRHSSVRATKPFPCHRSAGQSSSRPWSLRKLEENRCGDCRNCLRRRCGLCHSCTQAEGDCCIRRMCCKVRDTRKAQNSPYLPPGWTYIFDSSVVSSAIGQIESKLDGLVVLAPNNRRYFSIERAVNQSPALFGKLDMNPASFYSYAGLNITDEDKQQLQMKKRNREKPSAPPTKKRKTANESVSESIPSEIQTLDTISISMSSSSQTALFQSTGESLTPTQLYSRRCDQCAMCKKENCGNCYTCEMNASRTRRYKEVCLRKMCMAISESEKQQSIEGFPKGWYFFFESPEPVADSGSHPDLRGLRIISRVGLKFSSLNKAIRGHALNVQQSLLGDGSRKRTFYRHIGASLLEEIPSHPLVDRGHLQEWINCEGERQVLYGTITKVEKDDIDGIDKCTIVHSEHSREVLNAAPTTTGDLYIPRFAIEDVQTVWGGCLSLLTRKGTTDKTLIERAPFHIKWRVPDLYHREVIHPRDSSAGALLFSLPRVIIHFNMFKLTFTVRPSTITNAGYGVFLCCQPIFEEETGVPEVFELAPGELLDFGVYAPLRSQDRKSGHLFLLKNFVHEFECEDYSFNTPEKERDSIFDITDDLSGELHYKAVQHVPPFVNEVSSDQEVASVQARHDFQGALHYLLGHAQEDHGPFRIPADRVEREIFVDYGESYENIRIRKGFPRKGQGSLDKIENLRNEEREILNEIDTYTANEVQSTIKMFDNMLSSGRVLKPAVVERTVLIIILLKRRAQSIMEEFADLGDDASFCDNGATDMDLELIVIECGGLLGRLCRRWGNDRELHSRMLATDVFLKTCQAVFPGRTLEAMTPLEFRNLICRTEQH